MDERSNAAGHQMPASELSRIVQFLNEHRDGIVDFWVDYLSDHVSLRYRQLDRALVADRYMLPFEHCLNAMGLRLADTRGSLSGFYFKDINNFIASTIDEYANLGLTIEESKASLLSFATVLDQYIEKHLDQDTVTHFRPLLTTFAERLAVALNSTLSADILAVLEQHRDELLTRWVEELPSEVVSPHFRILAQAGGIATVGDMEFTSVDAFCDACLDIFAKLCRGTREGFDEFVGKTAETFENRGFELDELEPAIHHFHKLMEPLVYRHLMEDRDLSTVASIRNATTRLRVAHSQLREVTAVVSVRVADRFDKARTTKIHAEFEDMFHKVKNKIAELIGPLETLLTVDRDGNPYGPPMLIIGDQANVVQEWMQCVQELNAAIASADAEQPLAAADAIQEAKQKLDAFMEKNAETLQAVEMNLASIDVVDEFVDMTYHGAKYTTDLIRQLHEKQKALLQQKAKEWRPVPFQDLVSRAFEMHSGFAKQKDIEYTLDVNLNGERMLVIEDEVERVLDQTIHNALKYTPEGGRVLVKAYVDDGALVMSVKDSGIGIPVEVQKNLFSLFFRTEDAQNMDPAGSGTGLYEDRKTMIKHGGDISCESEGRGHGSTFFIRGPIYTESS